MAQYNYKIGYLVLSPRVINIIKSYLPKKDSYIKIPVTYIKDTNKLYTTSNTEIIETVFRPACLKTKMRHRKDKFFDDNADFYNFISPNINKRIKLEMELKYIDETHIYICSDENLVCTSIDSIIIIKDTACQATK